MRVNIIRISDEAIPTLTATDCLPAGQIGEITVNGPVVTQGYFGREQATKLAKMHDVEGQLWHRMGDIGYQDELGRIWFCGRKSHRVITDHGVLFTIPVEAIFNTHPAVYRSALVGVRRGSNQLPVVCIELEADVPKAKWPQILAELSVLSKQHELTKNITHLLCHPAFPVDIRHNAKIFRERLAIWAEQQLKRGSP